MTDGTRANSFQLGPWLLTNKLASGGMGDLFLGLRAGGSASQQPVVVKALNAPPPAAEQQAAQLAHPNLVRVLELGVDQRRHFLAMELVRGVSMSTLLAAAKSAGAPLPHDVLVHIGRAICGGLGAAHDRGLLHCDLTPHNVLASSEGDVKLTDFGVARLFTDSAGKTVQGKLEYVSPEQLEAQPPDARSEVYAAGVTLFTVSAFAEPFRRATPQATARAIRTEAPDDLARARPDLPPGFVAAVRRAMARKPADRFVSLADFAAALGPASAHAPRQLGDLVRALCGPELERIDAAVAQAAALAPEATALASPPVAVPPRALPPPRGTMEVEPPRLGQKNRWLWWALGLAAAFAAAGALFWKWV